jgi:glutaredoxin 3
MSRVRKGLPQVAQVEIYTRAGCGYCHRAVALLTRKGASFVQHDAGVDRERFSEMVRRAGGARTFPQIFIGGRHVGGCDDLHALEARGALDPMLAGDAR